MNVLQHLMMDSSEVEDQGEMVEDIEPSTSNNKSTQGEDGPKPVKAAQKRSADKPKKAKKKMQKRPGYTIHQGEDMLLLISSSTSEYFGSTWTPKKKVSKKKKQIKGKQKTVQIKKKKTICTKPKPTDNPVAKDEEDTDLFVPETSTDHRWGQSLPEEVLINIFQIVVVQDGAVPFLCRVGRVCRLWNAAASSPVLWRKVTVSFCCVAPGKPQQNKIEAKIKDTFDWLAQNRFSQLRDFSLCHWKKNVNYAVQVVSQFCPHLRSLTVSHCTGLTGRAFRSLGLHSRSLQILNLQYSEFQGEGLMEYLQHHGSQIKQIFFTYAMRNDKLVTAITRGYCPDLELLEVNAKLDGKNCDLSLCIQALQLACPKLKTFRMLNVQPLRKTMRNVADSELGFPLLEELCIATTWYSYMTDEDLLDILFGSTRLRILDLRGGSRITASGLALLPCEELECLFWGQYFTALSSQKAGLHILTEKWSQTLQQLDIANQLFTEEDLEMAMSHLSQATEVDTLRSLNLSGTRITTPALRSVVSQRTALGYLNLSSCRNLPRGVKRIYRSQEDIRQLLDKLE